MADDAIFRVDELVDLAARAELIIIGTLLAGRIAVGDTLRMTRTGESVPVLSIEFPGATVVPDQFTLLVPKDRVSPLQIGDLLESSTH